MLSVPTCRILQLFRERIVFSNHPSILLAAVAAKPGFVSRILKEPKTVWMGRELRHRSSGSRPEESVLKSNLLLLPKLIRFEYGGKKR